MPVNSPGFDRLWWFTASGSKLFTGTRCTMYFGCNMHRCESPSYKKTCHEAPGFIFYKHQVKERIFCQDSDETGPKHEETAKTRATLLEIGQHRRTDRSVRAPSAPIFCSDFQQKALKQIVFFWSFSCVWEPLIAWFASFCVIAWYVTAQSWLFCNLWTSGRKDVAVMAILHWTVPTTNTQNLF